MNNTQLALFIEDKIRLLRKAFEQVDGSMCGADRHEVFEYIGNSPHEVSFSDDVVASISATPEEEHRQENPFDWSEGFGTAKVLDPIKDEIEALKSYVNKLRSDQVELSINTTNLVNPKVSFINIAGQNQMCVDGKYFKITKRYFKLIGVVPFESDDDFPDNYTACEKLPF